MEDGRKPRPRWYNPSRSITFSKNLPLGLGLERYLYEGYIVKVIETTPVDMIQEPVQQQEPQQDVPPALVAAQQAYDNAYMLWDRAIHGILTCDLRQLDLAQQLAQRAHDKMEQRGDELVACGGVRSTSWELKDC